MNLLKYFIFINVLNLYESEPITIGLAGTLIFGIGSYIFNQRKINCFLGECCEQDSKWLPMNMTKLEQDLNNQLYGQHLVKLVLSKHLKSHLLNRNPPKALLLSFNGSPGTGKNFVSSLIANSIFKKGMKSKYVRLFVSSIHFPSPSKVEQYKEELRQKILDTVKQCPRSLFIFDEVQDMHESLLDVLKPFVDHHESIDGVDFRKSVFILLSNSGGKDVIEKLKEANSNGRPRESITLNEMEDALSKNVYHMKNDGLRNSKLISHYLITAFVPFLPLERQHVEKCIDSAMKARKLPNDREIINGIMESLQFTKIGTLELVSQGCKRIAEKVDLILE